MCNNTSCDNKKNVNHADSSLTTDTESSTLSSITRTLSSLTVIDGTAAAKRKLLEIPYTIALPLLVVLDMVGVSLVVPLLHSQYFQLAGVTSAVQREWLSSIFSASQIVGGLAMGALSDNSQLVSRHVILVISFVGSAFAYAMILEGGLLAIVISRVTVGLVKQTMTVTTSIMAHATPPQERATHVGRLNASVTVAWIVGPSAGAYLFSHAGIYVPIYVSCSLFLLNILIVLFCLPREREILDDTNKTPENTTNKNSSNDAPNSSETGAEDKLHQSPESGSRSAWSKFVSNFNACFPSNNSCLTSVVLALLLFQWVDRTTSYDNIASYYETRYGTQPYQRGYLQSYQSALTFVVQSLLVRPILKLAGGEVNAACGAALLMACVAVAELRVDFVQYLVLLCPLMAIGIAILGVSLKSIVSKVAPKQSLGSVFAAIDVLQNATQVTVPFYRTLLFSVTQASHYGRNNDNDNNILSSGNYGDPDPRQWLISSSVHWLLATVALSYLLLHGSPCASMDHDNENGDDREEQPKSSSKKVKAA